MEKVLLLVDDEENVLAALYRLLRTEGYTILRANGGAEGLALLEQYQPGVIISDQRMPNMTGVQFLSEAKKRYPDSIRIVLSGYSDLKSITDAVNEGAIYKFLSKPWDDEMVKATVVDAFRMYGVIQENGRLNSELMAVNQRMTEMVMTSRQESRLSNAALDVAKEILEVMPFPLVGVAEDLTIAMVNQAFINLQLGVDSVGAEALAVLPHEMSRLLRSPLSENGKPVQVNVSPDKKMLASVFEIGRDSQGKGRVIILQAMDDMK